jgi:hypothetical protein
MVAAKKSRGREKFEAVGEVFMEHPGLVWHWFADLDAIKSGNGLPVCQAGHLAWHGWLARGRPYAVALASTPANPALIVTKDRLCRWSVGRDSYHLRKHVATYRNHGRAARATLKLYGQALISYDHPRRCVAHNLPVRGKHDPAWKDLVAQYRRTTIFSRKLIVQPLDRCARGMIGRKTSRRRKIASCLPH